MDLNFPLQYNDTLKITQEVPYFLSRYAKRHFTACFKECEEGYILSMMYQGRGYKIWWHYLKLNESICILARTEEPRISINYTKKGNVFCVMHGYGELWLNEDIYHLYAIPHGINHHCYFEPGSYCFMHLDIEPELYYRINFIDDCKAALKKYLNDPQNYGQQLPACTILPIVDALIDDIQQYDIINKDEYDTEIDYKVAALLRELARQMPKKVTNSKLGWKKQKRQEIDDYLYLHINIHHTIDEVCEKVTISLRQIRSLYDNKEDKSPKHYFLLYKMRYALRCLNETNISLDKLSFDLGYAETSSFCRTFKNILGISPIQATRAKGKI